MRYVCVFLLVVMISGIVSAEQPEQSEQPEKRNWIATISTDILTYQMTLVPHTGEPLFDAIQFGGNIYSLHSTLAVPFAEWAQVLFGYKLTDSVYFTGTLAFGMNSIYYYDYYSDLESHVDEGNGRTNVFVLVFAPGLRYHLSISETVMMPLGLSLGYKAGFLSRKSYEYHAMQLSLYGGIQFIVTESFSLGPGVLFNFECGSEFSHGYKGLDENGWEGSRLILSFKTGLDFSLSFYF